MNFIRNNNCDTFKIGYINNYVDNCVLNKCIDLSKINNMINNLILIDNNLLFKSICDSGGNADCCVCDLDNIYINDIYKICIHENIQKLIDLKNKIIFDSIRIVVDYVYNNNGSNNDRLPNIKYIINYCVIAYEIFINNRLHRLNLTQSDYLIKNNFGIEKWYEITKILYYIICNNCIQKSDSICRCFEIDNVVNEIFQNIVINNCQFYVYDVIDIHDKSCKLSKFSRKKYFIKIILEYLMCL